jgi:DNA-binding FrmR family transcriptional regulator
LGGDEVGKKYLSNAVDEDIIRQFKAACALSDRKMNEVLEELMKSYVEQVAKKDPE